MLHFQRHLSCLRLGPDRHLPPRSPASLSASSLFFAKLVFLRFTQLPPVQALHHEPFLFPVPAIWKRFAYHNLCVGTLHFHCHLSFFRRGPERHCPPRRFANLSANTLLAVNEASLRPAQTSRCLCGRFFTAISLQALRATQYQRDHAEACPRAPILRQAERRRRLAPSMARLRFSPAARAESDLRGQTWRVIVRS